VEQILPEPITITTLLVAGATAAGIEAVKEATKDAYRAVKDKVGELFGPRASRAVAKLESDSSREEGAAELAKLVEGTLEPDEATQLQPLAEALIRALNEDAAAKQIVHSRVGLDIEAGGNALIRDIQGAREVVAKVKAAQDVTVEGLRMDTGRTPGK
jgi:hypothetical protein